MKDARYEEGIRSFTVEELAKFGEDKNIVYQIVSKYDTGNGYDVGIRATSNLEKALEILKKDFLEESEFWMKDSGMDDKEIEEFKEAGEDYDIDETYAYICLGDDYLSMYISVSEIE